MNPRSVLKRLLVSGIPRYRHPDYDPESGRFAGARQCRSPVPTIVLFIASTRQIQYSNKS